MKDMYFGDQIVDINIDHLPNIEGLAGPAPDTNLLKSIAHFGIIYPIILTRDKDGQYVVVDGRRRLKAAWMQGYLKVKAIIYDNLTSDDTATWALILNDQRSNNLITEFEYLKELSQSGDWETLRKEFGFNKTHVEKVLSLANIIDWEEASSAYEQRKISESALFSLAQLSKDRQKYVMQVLRTKGKVTLADIKEANRLQKQEDIQPLVSIPAEEPEVTPVFGVTEPKIPGIAHLFTDIQKAYEFKNSTSGARLYKMFEV